MRPPRCCLVHPVSSLNVPTQAQVKSTFMCQAHSIQRKSVTFENRNPRPVKLSSEASWHGRVERIHQTATGCAAFVLWVDDRPYSGSEVWERSPKVNWSDYFCEGEPAHRWSWQYVVLRYCLLSSEVPAADVNPEGTGWPGTGVSVSTSLGVLLTSTKLS